MNLQNNSWVLQVSLYGFFAETFDILKLLGFLYQYHTALCMDKLPKIKNWNWVIPEKIHTSPTDGKLEIQVGGGSRGCGNPGGISFIYLPKWIQYIKLKMKKQFSNYRPISVQPFFSKILWKLMFKRVYSFLENFNVLSNKEFGFRNNNSTTMAILHFIEQIHNPYQTQHYF